MKAWTVDADDIRVAEDFDDSLLHRTPEIDDFLSQERDDKFVLIATKGFGKTLLLKAKRILYQRDARAICLPDGNLLDKPIGDKIFGQEALQLFAASPLWWSKVWLTAISITILKRLDLAGGLDEVSPRLRSLVGDRHLLGVIDHFVRLLDFNPGDLQRCATDTDGHLVPRLRAVNKPIAVFIDGVDEYFNKHIESLGSRPSAVGQLSPEIWYYSQLGLVEIAYQLRRINHHLKVFAAVRKEAYLRLRQSTAMWLQYRGSAVDVAYSMDGLREIFVNNVRRESAQRLVRPERLKADPIEAFLGAVRVTHTYTREGEDAIDYLCRHTLLRPRDLMTIGQRLSALPPAERQIEQCLKQAVNEASTEIAHEYLREIAPYLGDLDIEGILRLLPGRILRRDEVEALYVEHNAEASGVEQHIFCALYKTGLLGYVHHDRVRGRKVQRFLRPGEGTFEPDGVLPEATHYVVHPVLSELIARLNPRYLERDDRLNIVGYHRPWRDAGDGDDDSEIEQLCVLKGDIDEFGDMMRLGTDGPVREGLERIVREAASAALYHEVRGGDSVVVVHDDPVALARMARRIIDELYSVDGQPRLRIALHFGEVRIRRRGDKPPLIEGGEALLWAARVETTVAPGEIWATAQFNEELASKPSLFRTTSIPATDGGARHNVRKEGSREPDMWVRLFRVGS